MEKSSEEQKSIIHVLFGAALLAFGIGAAFYLVFIGTYADDVPVAVDILSDAPSVDSVYVSETAGTHANDFIVSGISLNPDTTRRIYVNGTITDTNGYQDVDSVEVYFHLDSVTTPCIEDANNCYYSNDCILSGGAGLTVEYTCLVDLDYYADSTTPLGRYPSLSWVADVIVTDSAAVSGSNQSTLQEISVLTALSMPLTMDFGQMALTQTTTASDNVNFTLTQNGNNPADVEVSAAGSGLVCNGGGVIPRANLEWDLNDDGVGGTTFKGLTDTPFDTDVYVPYRESDTVPETKDLFWDMTIPFDGVAGSCVIDVLISVIAA